MKSVLHASVVFSLLSLSAVGADQTRRLGPADRLIILDARVDQSFSSTPLARVVVLPFSNELDYQEGAMMLGDNFLGAMRQEHPDIAVIGPVETLKIIKDKKLDAEYRSFLGMYRNTGVATTAFLQSLGVAAQVDGILMGQVLLYGVTRDTYQLRTSVGLITWARNKAVVGMELKLLRTKDGRELWWGLHAVDGVKDQNVKELSQVVGQVFAKYFGRLPY